MMNYYLGIDLGGTMAKAAIFDQNGNEIAIGEKKLKIIYPGKDMVERNIIEAKEAVYHVIEKLYSTVKLTVQKSRELE